MTETTSTTDAAFDHPDDREVHECSHCGRPFASARQRDLHLGEVHGDDIDESEREAYEVAMDEERDELWLYHFKAVVVLLAIYMATGLLYLIVLSG